MFTPENRKWHSEVEILSKLSYWTENAAEWPWVPEKVFSHKHSLRTKSCGISKSVTVRFHSFKYFDWNEKEKRFCSK